MNSRVTKILISALAIVLCGCEGPGPRYDSTEPRVGKIVWEHSLDGHRGKPVSLRLPANMGTLEFPAGSVPAHLHIVVRIVELAVPPGAREPIAPWALQIAPSNLPLAVAAHWRKELILQTQRDELAVWFSTGLDDAWTILPTIKTTLRRPNSSATEVEIDLDRTGLWRIEKDTRPLIVRLVGRYVLESGSCGGGPWLGAAVQALSIDVDGQYVWLDTALSSDPPITTGLAFMPDGSVPALFSNIQRNGDGFSLKLTGGPVCPGGQAQTLLFGRRPCGPACAAPLTCFADACGPPQAAFPQ